MSGVLALMPAMGAIPLPVGFFGTRIVALMFRDATGYAVSSVLSLTQFGPPNLGALSAFNGSFSPTVYGRNLIFDGTGLTTFDTSYPNCDIYVDGVFRLAYTRSSKSVGDRPHWLRLSNNTEMGIVNGAIHTIDAFYKP